MQLQLDETERDLLLALLQRELGDLRVEVRRTETPDYRDDLKVHEDRLEDLLQRLLDSRGGREGRGPGSRSPGPGATPGQSP